MLKELMNFLSHYYFERYAHDPELVLGSILPDLVKNADKDVNVLAHKFEDRFGNNPKLNSIYRGWLRHMETDRLFHNAAFFYEKTHELKTLLTPVVAATAIRPSFLSHITLELLLDHLLLENDLVNEADFYNYLAAADRNATDRFLKLCEVNDTAFFFKYFEGFLQAQYVGSYREFHQITSALIMICSRLWRVDVNADQREPLTAIITDYTGTLRRNFKRIFEEIGELPP